VDTFGKPALELLQTWVGPEVRGRYFESAEKILKVLEQKLNPESFIRIHGDCHKGNLLHSGTEFYFVDFDDFCNGPEVQDIWMLTGGDSEEARTQREILLEGYEELRAFDRSTLSLQEPLRGLRLLHYSAWIAKRWKDPSFPRLFPDFNTYPYWAEEAEELEQIAWRSMNQPS
jgi:Ser/Thr protein kinase RdoA (MazF antagonist)